MSNDEDGKLEFGFILSKMQASIKNRIFNPPNAESEQEKNLITIIRNLQKHLELDDDQIELFLGQYPISKGKDLTDLISKSKLSNPNEIKLGRDFADKLKDKLSFCRAWGKWLTWTGTHWEIDEIGESIEQIRIILEQTDMPDFRRRAATVKGIEYLVQSDPILRSRSDSWDQNPWLLATPNGTVNLKTGKLRISYQEDKITKITSVAPKKGEPKLWLKFLNEATLGDIDYISYLQRIAGYCLTGSIKEEALFFLYGQGGNGKGVFLNTLTAILGDYAIVAPMGTFVENKFDGHPTELALLRGARLVTAQETQEGKAWNEVKIISLTGGDPIPARFMREDFFNFLPTFKLLIAGNHEPSLKSVNDAIIRRFNKLPFVNKPPVPDKDLKENLKSEYPQILNWCIDGCLSWQQIGLNTPQVVKLTTQDYFEDQNNLNLWLEECCKIDPKYKITSARAFTSWCAWASKNHFRQGTDKTLKESLERNGFKYNKNVPFINDHGVGSRGRGYEGFRLK